MLIELGKVNYMTKNNDDQKGIILKQPKYTLEVKYSDEAIAKKLMKFTAVGGGPFEISAEEMISILVNQVNTETLAPAFVDMEKVNVVQVMRQIKAVTNNDVKKGQEIIMTYYHPYPLEYAILEEAYKIASIKMMGGRLELTKEFIDGVKKELQPGMEDFTKKFYKNFRQIDLEKKKEEEKKV